MDAVKLLVEQGANPFFHNNDDATAQVIATVHDFGNVCISCAVAFCLLTIPNTGIFLPRQRGDVGGHRR